MGRGRLAMKLIEKEKSRKVTFQKRKNGIMKKVSELSTLCGVDCCMIIYCPNSINDLPGIWPPNFTKVNEIIEKYRVKTTKKGPKKYNIMDFFKDMKTKVEVEACKLQKERLRKLYPTWDFSFDKLGEEQLRMFVALLDSKIEDCKERVNMLKKKRYIAEKQQQQQKQGTESSASVSNRSHLSFMHNNNSNNTTLSAHHHQNLDFALKFEDHHQHHQHAMLHPFHTNLMPLMMITQNDSAATQINDAFGHHYDLMRESCPSSSYCYNNNNNYYPCLQNNTNIMQFHHHEANLQVLNPAAFLMMQELQTHYGYHHHDLLQVHQKFNHMDQKK